MATVRVIEVYGDRRRTLESLLSRVLQSVDASELTFSRYSAHILLDTLASLHLKKTQKETLSSSSVVLITLLLARRLSRDGQPTDDDQLGEEIARLRLWGDLLGGDFGDRLDKMVDEFFEQGPVPSIEEFSSLRDVSSLSDISCGPGLHGVLISLSYGGGPIRIDDLVLRLMEDERTGIAQRMSTAENQDIHLALRSAIATRGGRRAEMVRAASQTELALGIADYALAIATVLRAAKGEFTFALFGHWGSGKTTLTEQLTPLLQSPAKYQKESGASDDAYARRRYAVAFHNAWKYRSRPECWIYTYRSFVEAASAAFGPVGRLLLALRVSVLKSGAWPLTLALLSLAVLAIPFTAKVQLAVLAVSMAGLWTCMYLASVTINTKVRVRELFAKHLRLAPVDEKLGMLALVGDDVRALLLAWVSPLSVDPDDGPRQGFPWSRLALPLCALVAVACIWLIALLGWWLPSLERLAKLASESIPEAWRLTFENLGPDAVSSSPPIGQLAVFITWVATVFVLIVVPWLPCGERPQRVLMIVDDLDRCSPDEMLDVIEGMRLLLDDSEINKRLQIMMLVDEGVLAHGIAQRYKSMIDERASDEGKSQSIARLEIVAEQNEKLFACHLRMARLTDVDVSALVNKLAGAELEGIRRAQLARNRERDRIEREAADETLRQARERARLAESRYEDVRSGKQLPLVDEDAPSERQPMYQRRMTGGEPLPPRSDELERRRRKNADRETWNQRIAAQSEKERFAESPNVVRERDEAAAALKQALELNGRLSSESNVGDETTSVTATPPFESNDVRFTVREIEQLERVVPRYFRELGRRPSPRAIRLLLFKVQLCRLLLQLRFPGRPPQMRSVEAILNGFRQAAEAEGQGGSEPENVTIARQVI